MTHSSFPDIVSELKRIDVCFQSSESVGLQKYDGEDEFTLVPRFRVIK